MAVPNACRATRKAKIEPVPDVRTIRHAKAAMPAARDRSTRRGAISVQR